MNQRASREMQADIEETRAEIGRTVDEIETRVSPSHIVDQVLWHLRSGGGRAVADGAGEFTSNLVRTIRDNPVPSLLIGTGLAWFAVASMRGRDRSEHEQGPYDREIGRRAPGEAAARYGERMGRHEGSVVRDPDPTMAPAREPGPRRTPTAEAVRAADPHAPFGRQNVDATPVRRPEHRPQQAQTDPAGARERARRSAEEARERAERASGTTPGASAAAGTPESGLHGMSTVEAVRAADPDAPFSPRSIGAKHPKH